MHMKDINLTIIYVCTNDTIAGAAIEETLHLSLIILNVITDCEVLNRQLSVIYIIHVLDKLNNDVHWVYI